MADVPSSSSEVREFLAQCRADKQRVAVCVGRDGVHVTYDQRGGEPYRPPGDYVGHVLRIDEDVFTIGGWSFNTVIAYADVRGIWRRDESPNPCICGQHYECEPERPVPGSGVVAFSTQQPCPTCAGTKVIDTDRPGATSPRPCRACATASSREQPS